MWLTTQQALTRLGSKPQSLYANVSRGRIRARPDPADNRRSLYSEEDVDRLARRARGRRSGSAIAAETISWGEPLLPTSLSTISNGRLYYRGQDATLLAQTATLEDVAALLWGAAPAISAQEGEPAEAASAFEALARLAVTMPPSDGRPLVALQADAALVYQTIAAALAGREGEPAHLRLARGWQRPDAREQLRRALVLLADHELNASTFAARVAVSTGASLAAGALAGLAALSGPRHGGAARQVLVLAEDIGSLGPHAAETALREWLGEGRGVPGFGHRLYPTGDTRAAALLEGMMVPPALQALADAAERVTGELPNIDFSLTVLTQVHDLPEEAPATIFALARAVGWLAHMLEQATTGTLIRPRARYSGRPPQD